MRILNFGSLNLDYTYRVSHIAAPGETITSKSLDIRPGGKGLNQSTALAKAGADVYHAGLIGKDGMMLSEICEKSGAHTEYIGISEVRSGNAIIQVDDQGQNCIILFPGANRAIEKEYVNRVLDGFCEGEYLLLQNEISCLPYIIDKAYEKGMKIILNPSPMDDRLKECDLQKISMFILNEVEGGQLTGVIDPEEILVRMHEIYPHAEIVLTLGADGAVFYDGFRKIRQEIFPTEVKDTTGAGDTFTGFFITEYIDTKDPADALQIASIAASIAVSREGAAGAVPFMEEVQRRLKRPRYNSNTDNLKSIRDK